MYKINASMKKMSKKNTRRYQFVQENIMLRKVLIPQKCGNRQNLKTQNGSKKGCSSFFKHFLTSIQTSKTTILEEFQALNTVKQDSNFSQKGYLEWSLESYD